MDFDKYKNTFEYPRTISRNCSCGAFFNKNDNFCSKCGNNVKKAYEDSIKERKEKIKAYNDEAQRLDELFKNDVLKYVGLENHPKKDIIYGKAYKDGHSYGYPGVLDELEVLSMIFAI